MTNEGEKEKEKLAGNVDASAPQHEVGAKTDGVVGEDNKQTADTPPLHPESKVEDSVHKKLETKNEEKTNEPLTKANKEPELVQRKEATERATPTGEQEVEDWQEVGKMLSSRFMVRFFVRGLKFLLSLLYGCVGGGGEGGPRGEIVINETHFSAVIQCIISRSCRNH